MSATPWRLSRSRRSDGEKQFLKALRVLCHTTQGQFPNFQIHLLERISRCSSSFYDIAGSAEFPDLLANQFDALREDSQACVQDHRFASIFSPPR